MKIPLRYSRCPPCEPRSNQGIEYTGGPPAPSIVGSLVPRSKNNRLSAWPDATRGSTRQPFPSQDNHIRYAQPYPLGVLSASTLCIVRLTHHHILALLLAIAAGRVPYAQTFSNVVMPTVRVTEYRPSGPSSQRCRTLVRQQSETQRAPLRRCPATGRHRYGFDLVIRLDIPATTPSSPKQLSFTNCQSPLSER